MSRGPSSHPDERLRNRRPAAFGVWRGQPWAPRVVVFLGVAVAATSLVEAFVLGIVAYLHAILVAVAAIVIFAVIAAYLNRRAGLSIL